jgi:hypothetical protein
MAVFWVAAPCGLVEVLVASIIRAMIALMMLTARALYALQHIQ